MGKLSEWLKDSSRDTLALGGIAFCILVLARASIGQYLGFVYQILLALGLSFVLALFIKKSETKIARGIILVFFTILFYNEKVFTIFAIFVLILMIASAVYLKIEKKAIALGILLGVICSAVSYYLLNYLGLS